MEELSKYEIYATIEAINHAIAYRLNNQTRRSEIKDLRSSKVKLEQLLKSKTGGK